MQHWPQPVLLHDHLDGSRALASVIPQLFRLSGKEYPFNPWGDVHKDMETLFQNPQIDIVEKFSNTTGVMQTRETLSLAAETYVRFRARQGFRYCEATIAPQYHTFGGLTVPEVLDAMIEGIKRGEAEFPETEFNLLPSVGREVSPEEAVRLIELFAECDRRYCPGVGLVCDEAAHPPEKHIPMFRRAKELGFKTTCHAGEWVSVPPDLDRDLPQIIRNIQTAIFELEADRIGHAIGLAYNPELMSEVVRRQIGVEGCPGSNMTTGMLANVGLLGIRELLRTGVLYSIHPDDDLFLPDLNEVFQMCNDVYRFTEEEKQLLIRNAWLTRFGNRKEHKF